MKDGKFDPRIRRAQELVSSHPFASEGLRFYECIAQIQKSLYVEFESHLGAGAMQRPPGALRQELDLFLLLPRFGSFLSAVEQSAPSALSESARELRAKEGDQWREILTQFWQAGSVSQAKLPPTEALISWMFLQPYAEYLADHTVQDPLNGTPSLCPVCHGEPLVGVLRPEGDGAKRSLICALCATEWNYRRIVCPACGEEDVHKLAVYTAEEFKHVRVEACDTCRSYLKTVDLTKDGHAVPDVDELATIPLNLWAAEHGYVKSHTNLLGI